MTCRIVLPDSAKGVSFSRFSARRETDSRFSVRRKPIKSGEWRATLRNIWTIRACEIAFRRTVGESGKAGLVWLGGFHSDMLGEKATTLHDSAARAGRSFVRFDYLGHGESGGQLRGRYDRALAV
jgi:hypothetical protein